MLSYEAICVSHTGHLERGETTLRPSGIRPMTTFKKLPMVLPTMKTQAHTEIANHRGRSRAGVDKKASDEKSMVGMAFSGSFFTSLRAGKLAQ